MVNDLILKTPESEGLSSIQINKFIDKIQNYKLNIHSFMMVKNGNIIAEGYCPPFNKDFMHRLYSSSKTYVSMAIGKLIGEGKIKLTDKMMDLLPKYANFNQHRWIKEVTVEDCLKMSVPMLTDTYFARDYKEWAWTFFNHPTRSKALKPASTVFNYNTSGTFMLDVLVEELTGKTFLEYLRPEFDKIGISKNIWCVKSPDGYAWGGSGVVCTMRDFAKFSELILNKGNYKGEQILPKEYMEKATSKQIYNLTENWYYDSSCNGYGYQIWITKHGFALLGMGCQVAFCFPEKNFLFVCNGDTQCNNDLTNKRIYDIVYDLIYSEIQDKPLDENINEYRSLTDKLKNMHLPLNYGEKESTLSSFVNNKKYILEENPMGWKWVKLTFDNDAGNLEYENNRGTKNIPFLMEDFKQCKFPENHYYDKQVDKPSNRELDCITSASWVMENQLLLRIYIIDSSLGNCFMTFGFKRNEIGIMLNKRAEFFLDDYVGYAGGQAEGE